MSKQDGIDRLFRLRLELQNLVEYFRTTPDAEFSRPQVEAVIQMLLGTANATNHAPTERSERR